MCFIKNGRFMGGARAPLAPPYKSAPAARLKNQKNSSLAPSHTFVALAIETFGPWNQAGLNFINDLGRRTTTITGDPREASFLFQRISSTVQMGNAVSFAGTFPREEVEDIG